jgi:polyisoprenyl-phosphate glycosyltransferase
MKKINIIIPCYNEENNIDLIIQKIREVLDERYTYEIIMVDDGSKDNTLGRIRENAARYPGTIKYLAFSKNFGHQYALIAGLEYADADCVIMMDADLQHPPAMINDMLAKWEEGYDIVYTLRQNDKSLSLFKRGTSSLFYSIINFLSDIKLEEGAADFRLLDRKVLLVFKNNINESHIFLRGLINWVGFKRFAISFVPDKRHSGKTKYSVKKMTNFAIDGITSFSTKPLRLAVLLGFFLALSSFIYGVYAVIMRLFTQATVGGWTSTILSILFIGGVIILILGMIGEYIGKIYFEVKKRPRFIIRESNYE